MTTTTRRTACFAAAIAVLAVAGPASTSAALPSSVQMTAPRISPPPRPVGLRMHWYRQRPSTRTLQSRAAEFGSVAVLGLESMRDLSSLRALYGFERVHAIPALRAAQVSVDAAQLRLLLANAQADSRIRYVTPVGPAREVFSPPNDPLIRTVNPATNLPFEWQFAAASVDRALELSPGSPSIVVGVVDTGVADVPDLAGKVDARWTLDEHLNPVPGGSDVVGHGTAVASLIAANVDDGFGMAGFGGASHVISFRLDTLNDPTIATAITKLVSLGVRIINLSIGGRTPDSPIMLDALHHAAAAGVLLVAAAGNDQLSVSYPAADLQPAGGARSYGLAVGASNGLGASAGFSNWGAHLSLAAPGDYSGACSGVLVAIPPLFEALDGLCYSSWTGEGGARYAVIPGTSFAAPEVAGIAALVWAARPELRNDEVADILKQSASRDPGKGWTQLLGCGRLDAAAALELATGRSSAGPPCTARGSASPAWPSASRTPIVVALPASGHRGSTVDLPFRIGHARGPVEARVSVRRGRIELARLTRASFDAQTGQMVTVAWAAPAAGADGVRFCVVLRTQAGLESAPSCAPIRLR